VDIENLYFPPYYLLTDNDHIVEKEEDEWHGDRQLFYVGISQIWVEQKLVRKMNLGNYGAQDECKSKAIQEVLHKRKYEK